MMNTKFFRCQAFDFKCKSSCFYIPKRLNQLIARRLLPASAYKQTYIDKVESSFVDFWNPAFPLKNKKFENIQSWIIPLLPASNTELKEKIHSYRRTFLPISLSIETPDGAILDATFYQHRNAINNTHTTIVIPMASGELHKMGTYSWVFDLIDEKGSPLNVISFDYRGVGASKGKITPQNLIIDFCAVLGYLQAQHIYPENIIIYGFSLAGAISVEALNAAKAGTRKLILDRTFASLEQMIFYLLGGGITGKICSKYLKMAGWNFVSSKNLSSLAAQITVLFSKQDLVIPLQQSLYYKLQQKKEMAANISTVELLESRKKNEEHHNLPLNFFHTKNDKSLIKYLINNVFY